MNQTRTKERRFVYIQCKVLSDSKSPKFGDGGRPVLGHPSSLGARPLPGRPCPWRGGRWTAQANHGAGAYTRVRARARKQAASVTFQPTETEENKM
jgi:hypothetical protein